MYDAPRGNRALYRATANVNRATSNILIIMEACNAVEREVDKVLSKFGAINEHAEVVLRDLINHIQSLKKDLEEGKCEIMSFISMFFLPPRFLILDF